MNFIQWFYAIGCAALAFSVPYLSDDSMTVSEMVITQLTFVLIGALGIKTFSD